MTPKIRPLEIIPIEHNGEEYLLLRDRLGFAPEAQIPRVLAPLLSLFDGTRDEVGIVGAYASRGGEKLPLSFVQQLAAQLDEQFFLQSPRFEAHLLKAVHEFEQSRVRAASLAGQSYPAAPVHLQALLNGFWQQAAELEPVPEYLPHQLCGIVVPHIDFSRGGPVEALAYRHLARAAVQNPFDTLVVLGIAHNGVEYPFCAAAKDFDTPLGEAQADRDFLEALRGRIGDRLLQEQFAHKNEHSIEFVAVFQQYAEALRSARLVPIICGGFFHEIRRQNSPGSTPDIAQFIEALRAVTSEWEEQGKHVGFIASVDLAHVGSRFGDERGLRDEDFREIETQDRAFLACIGNGDAEALHNHIARDNNLRNVDAHPAVYSLLAAFPHWRGQLLHYAQTFDAPANSLVSFAAMALYE